MAYEFDFENSTIEVLSPQVNVDIQDLYNAIRDAEASEEGMLYASIANASGKENLGGDVSVGVTVELLGNWQLHFFEGNYIAKVSGGNLVGGPGGDPIAYSAGVQVLLIQSAASTIVNTSSGALSATQEAALYAARDEARKGRKMLTNKAVISSDQSTVTIYDDDGTSVLMVFDVTDNKLTRTPRS